MARLHAKIDIVEKLIDARSGMWQVTVTVTNANGQVHKAVGTEVGKKLAKKSACEELCSRLGLV